MIIVEEWVKSTSREIRTSHLILNESCIERGGNSTVHRGVLAQFLNTNFPSKVDLCHACNNDKCSNPKHLYWGTRKENVKDSILAGTHTNGWNLKVAKYGELEARRLLREIGSLGWAKGGAANKGKPKPWQRKENVGVR